jgi:site-specific recombinase XerC
MLKTRANSKWEDINMAELDLTKLISHFAQSNSAEGKSPKTVTGYTEMLFDFIKFLRSNGMEAILGQLSTTTVRQFVISEQGRALSPYTVQAKVRALKAFSSWLFAEGYTTDNLLASSYLLSQP